MKQIWSKSLACLLCLALLVGMLPVAALAEDNPPANGEVSLADVATDTPIVISSVEDLKKIGTDAYPMDGSYVLTANINLGASAKKPWTSIGKFTGTFDGDGHTISGLYLNAGNLGPTDQGLGLFTMVGEGGTVKNLAVEGIIDCSKRQLDRPIGGIVGKNNGGTISNCTSIVDITGSVDSNVGGIVGSSESGTIENCCNTGSINVTGSVDSNVGGIVGLAGNPNGRVTVTVENCENTGKVTVGGKGLIGGIVGRANGGSTVSNCRNSGDISANKEGNSITGGIVGENYGAIFRCYNTGAVTGAVTGDGATGGIAGRNVSDSNGPSRVENCCNTGDVTGAVSGSGDVGGVVGHNNNSNYFISTVKNCYNTGAVISGNSSNVGGVVGQIATGDVSDCYYLGQEGLPGIGSVTGETGTKVENIITKTAGQFASGEVAWLLQRWQNEQDEQDEQVWGQQLTGESVDPHPVLTDEEDLSVLQVTFKDGAEGNKLYAYGYANSGAPVANWPADPEAPEGQAFAGWYSGDTKCESDATFTEDTTLTAKFETPYTVTVNGSYAAGTGAGSYFAGASVTVSAGARPGYRFAGWTAEGVTLTNASAKTVTFVMPASNVALTASWDYIVIPSDPTYPPAMDEPENGAVTTSPSRPEEGDAVTITPKPDEGFEVDEIHITDENGKEIAVTQNPDGTYTFTQPDGKVTITVTFRCDGGELCPGHHLTDVSKDAWYHAAVDYVVKQGIMEGMSATTFSPNIEVTRAQAVQILYNLEGQPTVDGDNEFTDVSGWYETAVTWAAQTGVATGYGDGTFQPGDNITRQEFAQMLYNYAKYKGYDLTAEGDLSQFPDSGSVADWAEAAMSWANGNELINGHDNGTIDAGGTAIRAQAASILMKFDQNLTEE